jgi:hypothetical protein
VAGSARSHAAVLHQVLRLEMRPGVILDPASVNDRQFPFAPRILQRSHPRVQAEEIVESHTLCGDRGQPGAGAMKVVVAQRRNERESIGRAAQENHHERSPLIALAADDRLRRHGQQA